MKNDSSIPKEGDLYKEITISGHIFELRYGYYEEYERQNGPPVVIYPDLEKEKIFTEDGYRIVSQVQDSCEYYKTETLPAEEWCSDCIYFFYEEKEIGVCRNENKRELKQGGTENV
ncbi:MAG: hypothetical protein E7384_06945 [Ruminococcaceae bacterium]|nr:hypothetical protein [Oscillospiraceae bacterium]